MRLIPPVIPGMAFLVSAAAEVGILATQGATLSREAVPLWVQLIPMGIVLGIGSWGLIRLFAHERETTDRFEELEEKQRAIQRQVTERSESRHQENVARMDAMTTEIQRMGYLLLGIQGQGGLMTEQKINQERRHQLAQDITAIYTHIHYLSVWVSRAGEQINLPYAPPPIEYPPRRRRGESE